MADAIYSRSPRHASRLRVRARACVIAASALVIVARSVVAAEGWSDEPGGAELSDEWHVDRSGESKGSVAVKSGVLVLTAEEARHHHVECELGVDGTDAAPLRVECRMSSGQMTGPLPTVLALYWDADSAIGVGPTFLDWQKQAGRAWWIDGGVPGAGRLRPYLGRWGTWAHFRIVVASRDVSAFASPDGLRFTRVASFARGEGRFEGPPRLAIVGRGAFAAGDARAPDLDNDAGNIWQKDLKTFSFAPVRVTRDVPRVPDDPPPGYEKLDDWEKTLEAWRALGIPKRWWLLGPLEPRKEPYGPESGVDLEQTFELQAGIDYYVQLPNTPSLEDVQEGDYTLAAWVKPASVPAGRTKLEKKYALIAKEGRDTGLFYTQECKFEAAHRLERSPQVFVKSGRAFEPGAWHHVAGALSWTEGKVRIYVDGRLEGTAGFPRDGKSHEFKHAPWRIGISGPRSSELGYALDGEVDDVRIYGKALSAEEVAALHRGGNAPGIVAAVADDPDDEDTSLGEGDTLTVVFDVPTNKPPARTRAEIDGLMDFGGKPPGGRYRGEWRDDRTLVVTIDDARGGTLSPDDRISVRADGRADLRNRAAISPPSTASAAIVGDWGEPVPEGLVGWWRFDEGGGPKAADSSGNGNDGAIRRRGTHGAYAWRPRGGRKGGSLKFEYWDDPGSNRTEGFYVGVPDAPELNPTGAVTVSTWANAVRWGGYGFYWPALVRKEDQYSLESHEVEMLRFYVRLGRRQVFAECKTPSAGEWHHLAGVYDGRRLRLYVDGRLAAEKNASGQIATTANSLHIGTRLDREDKFYDGRLDDVRVYDRALGEEEIARLYQVDAPGSSVVGCWQFDEKDGEVALDSSGRENHGKVVGGQRVAGRAGGALSFRMRDGTWRPYEVPADRRSPLVRLASLVKSAGRKSTAFAYTRIIADEAGPERFYFDGEREAELYVNGSLVGSCETRSRQLIPDRVAAQVELAKGANDVLFKVTRERSNCRFTFRHETGHPSRRVALLRQLIADFPEDRERSARALTEIAAAWEEAGLLRRAIEVLAEVEDVEGAPAGAARDAACCRVRLLNKLRDHRAAAAELEGIVASLPDGSSEEFEFALDLLRTLVRAGDEPGAEAVARELGAGKPGRAARAHGVLASVYEARGDAAKRLAQLEAILDRGGEADVPDDSLLVERAEALLAPFRRAYETRGLPDAPDVRAALRHYRDAIAALPSREHDCVSPLLEKAEAATERGDLDVALGLLSAAYFRAWMVRTEAGENLVRGVDGMAFAPPTRGTEAKSWDSVLKASQTVTARVDQVKDWWAVGGFDNTDWKAYGQPFVGPGKVDVTKPVRGKKWRRMGPDAYAQGFLDLDMLQKGENLVAYLYTEVDSDSARKTDLRIGADDGFTVWLNGKKVHEDRTQRAVVPDEVVIPVALVKGRNTVLARVQNGTGPWGFMMRITGVPLASHEFASFLHMLEHYPEHHGGLGVYALQKIARSLEEQKRRGEALAVLRAVARAFPGDPVVVAQASAHAIAMALSENTDPAFAAEVAAWVELVLERRGMRRGDEALRDARIHTARALRAVGDLAGAADRLRAVVRSDPRSDAAGRACMDLAEMQREAGLRRAASGSYGAALSTEMTGDALRVRAHRALAELRRTGGETVAFDVSFDAATLVRTGDRAARRGDLERALRCYQQAVAGHGGGLFRLSDTKFVGVAEYCADRVRALGAEGRAMYRRLFDRRAASLLKRADDSGDTTRLFDLIRSYNLSSFGDDALNRAGNLELERGRAASAARTFAQLLEDHPDTDLDRSTLLAKLAFAHELAGDGSAAEGALDRLAREFGGGEITVSGEEKPVARYVADARRRLPAMAGTAPSGGRGAGSWSTWGGSERRTGFSRDAPTPAPCRLEVRFPEEPTDVLARRRLWPSPYRHVMAHAAAEGGKAFFATLTEAFAVDLATGALEWRSGVPFESLRSPEAGRAFGGMPETAPTVLGGQVFCRALRRSGPDLSGICAVQARDVATGELRWSTELTEGLDGMTAVTPPCALDGRVFALFRDLGESRRLSAVCLDAAQGELLWQAPIVSGFAEVELSREKRLHIGDHAAAPAAAGGDVYFSTDLGAVAAVDAATGSVRWIAHYPRARFDVNRSPRQRHLLAARAPGRVVVGKDALYVCSRDALAVRCISRGNGDVAWSIDLADCRTVTGLVPATGGGAARLVVQGEAVECIDAVSGSRLWRWAPPEASGA
ncbi:MAG: LamG-like jellyroll fold domain-containing protein, partial [Planctomycetota bacterium]